MARIPSKYTPYEISDVTTTPISGQFRAYGSDYSEINDNIVYFSSIPLERTVTFKAFFDSIKINFQKQVDEIKKAQQNYTIVAEKHTELSYDITMNLPAHSVNESRNNLAKIEELQRLILPGNWNFTPLQQGLGSGISLPALNGASNRTLEVNPTFSVLFKNIINSGAPHNGGYGNLSFEDILNLGFSCTIESVDYVPDEEAGYFEYDSYLFPKNIKLSLKLIYETAVSLLLYRGFKTIEGLDAFGCYNEQDTSLFPFHSYLECSEPFSGQQESVTVWKKSEAMSSQKLTMKSANEIFTGNEKIDSYIFISLPGSKDTSAGMTGDNLNYVLFKSFIVDYNRLVETEVSRTQGSNRSINNRTISGGITKKSPIFQIKFNVPASSMHEAKQNAAKIQYLSRLFLKKDPTSTGNVQPAVPELDTTEAGLLKNLCFYIPSMIEKPSITPNLGLTKDPGEMLKRSVELFLEDFSFEIDFDLGFFEDGSKIYPKAYQVTLKMKNTETDLINTYFMVGNAESEFYRVVPPSTSQILDNTNAHLFPFSRKTVKIGGK